MRRDTKDYYCDRLTKSTFMEKICQMAGRLHSVPSFTDVRPCIDDLSVLCDVCCVHYLGFSTLDWAFCV